MKVVSWNVRGASSPPKKYYILWKTLFDKEWDVLCAMEHKSHDLVGSVLICVDTPHIMQGSYHIITQG